MSRYFLFIHEEKKWYSGGKTLLLKGRKSLREDEKRSETIQEWQSVQFVFNIELR